MEQQAIRRMLVNACSGIFGVDRIYRLGTGGLAIFFKFLLLL